MTQILFGTHKVCSVDRSVLLIFLVLAGSSPGGLASEKGSGDDDDSAKPRQLASPTSMTTDRESRERKDAALGKLRFNPVSKVHAYASQKSN